jgi:hypothetical protein
MAGIDVNRDSLYHQNLATFFLLSQIRDQKIRENRVWGQNYFFSSWEGPQVYNLKV